MTLSVTSAVVAQLSYDGRAQRTADRSPTPVAEEGAEGEFSYAHRFAVLDSLPVSVMYIDPTRESALPPPGLLEWPDAGTTVVSPAVLEFSGEVSQTYGPVAGTIELAGLASPSERLIYVRPSEGAVRSGAWTHAAGYGNVDRNAQAGEIWQVQPLSALMMLVVALLFAPALILAATAAALDEEPRRKRHALLEALGVRPAVLVRREMLACAPPVFQGAAVAAAFVGFAAVVNVRLPGVGYALYAADLRRGWASILIGVLFALVVVFFSIFIAVRPRKLRAGARPIAAEPKYSGPLAAGGALLVTVLGIVAQQQAAVAASSTILWFYAGTIAGVVFIPAISGWLTRQVGRLIHAFGRRFLRPSAIVTGAQVTRSTRGLARQVSLTAVTMFIVSQASVVNLLGLQDAVAAEAAYQQFDGHYAFVGLPTHSEAQSELPAVLSAMPPDSTVVQTLSSFRSDGGSGQFTIHNEVRGPAEELRSLGLRTGEMAASEVPSDVGKLLGVTPGSVLTVTEGQIEIDVSSDLSNQQLLVSGSPAGSADQNAIKGAIKEVVVPSWPVGLPGTDWRTGAALAAFQSRWITWLGIVGAAVLIAAGAFRGARDARVAAQNIAPFGAVTGNRGFIRAVCALRGALVAIVGCAVGAVFAFHFSGVVHIMGLPTSSVDLVIALLTLATVIAAVAIWVGSAHAGLRAAATWKPGAERGL